MEEKFLSGEFVVMLSSCDGSNCWFDSLPENYCYELDRDSYNGIEGFHVKLDARGKTSNGWSASRSNNPSGIDKLKFRRATASEILKYQELGKPYDVRTFDFTPKESENLDYLIDLIKKLNNNEC